MINFKNKDDAAPSLLILLAILTLIGSLYAMIFVKKPTVAGLVKKHEASRLKIEADTDQAEARAKEAEEAVRPRLWSGDVESVTASILGLLTMQANQRGLKVAAFRPQKLVLLEGVTELPFSLQVSGSYLAVRSFAAVIDAPGSKLVLRTLQFAGSDGASDMVTATFGVSAYMLPAVTTEAATSTSTATPPKGGTK